MLPGPILYKKTQSRPGELLQVIYPMKLNHPQLIYTFARTKTQKNAVAEKDENSCHNIRFEM